MSHLDDIFKSETFKTWKQVRDNTLKLPGVLVGRLDNISKQIHGLGKALAARR